MAELVVPGCWRIGFGLLNAYLVDTGADRLTVVDAGSPWFGHPRRIVAAIRGAGRQPSDVGDIVISHQHIDHAGGAAAVATAAGARVHIHELDAPELEAGAKPRDGFGRNWFTRPIAKGSNLFALPQATVQDHPTDGEQLAMGLTAIHTPGHTNGHLAYLWPEHGGVLFVGDALANLRGTLGHAPVAADWDEVMVSAEKLARLDFNVALFGHGRPIRRDAAVEVRRFLGIS